MEQKHIPTINSCHAEFEVKLDNDRTKQVPGGGSAPLSTGILFSWPEQHRAVEMVNRRYTTLPVER